MPYLVATSAARYTAALLIPAPMYRTQTVGSVVPGHLEQVPVAGDHLDRVEPFGRGQGADHVVGLEAVGTGGGDADRGQHVEQDRHLR